MFLLLVKRTEYKVKLLTVVITQVDSGLVVKPNYQQGQPEVAQEMENQKCLWMIGSHWIPVSVTSFNTCLHIVYLQMLTEVQHHLLTFIGKLDSIWCKLVFSGTVHLVVLVDKLSTTTVVFFRSEGYWNTSAYMGSRSLRSVESVKSVNPKRWELWRVLKVWT